MYVCMYIYIYIHTWYIVQVYDYIALIWSYIDLYIFMFSYTIARCLLYIYIYIPHPFTYIGLFRHILCFFADNCDPETFPEYSSPPSYVCCFMLIIPFLAISTINPRFRQCYKSMYINVLGHFFLLSPCLLFLLFFAILVMSTNRTLA